MPDEFLSPQSLTKTVERFVWLSLTDFQVEVRSLYPGRGGATWYREEKKKHKNWPSHPDEFYKDKGWIDWSWLFGKENHLKKEFLPFAEFQAEVSNLYRGQGDIQKWYHRERRKRQGWHSHPDKIYKDEGWIDWPELVDRDNRLKQEWLSFTEFQTDIQSVYRGQKPIMEWYKKERANRPYWPANPEWIYPNDWQGFPRLVKK